MSVLQVNVGTATFSSNPFPTPKINPLFNKFIIYYDTILIIQCYLQKKSVIFF